MRLGRERPTSRPAQERTSEDGARAEDQTSVALVDDKETMESEGRRADIVDFFDQRLGTPPVRFVVGTPSPEDGIEPTDPAEMGRPVEDLDPDVRDAVRDITGEK